MRAALVRDWRSLRRGAVWTRGTNPVYPGHSVTKLPKPGIGIPADQADTPSQRVGTGSGDTSVDKRVEDLALGLPESGHHRCRMGSEQFPGVTRDRAPG